jgi:hypothetical protein
MNCSMVLHQSLSIREEYGSSCLKKLYSYLNSTSESGRIFQSLLDPKDFRDEIDHLLAVFIPGMRPQIEDYYEGRGPRMVKTYRADFIKTVDRLMLAGVKQGDAIWSLCKDEADRQGTTREEMLKFVSPKLSQIFQPLKAFDLKKHYLEEYSSKLLSAEKK